MCIERVRLCASYMLLNRICIIVRQIYKLCLDEIPLLLHANQTDFKELLNTEWLVKLMFFTDTTIHLNTLSKKFQGHGQTIEIIFVLIKGFEIKIDIFI